MQTQYSISSECIAAIIQRLSLGLGDFEGLFFGNRQLVNSTKLKDDGSYETFTIISIHNLFLLTGSRIISGVQLQDAFQQVPPNSQIVGWLAGRREVPLLPSVCDKSTFIYLNSLLDRFPSLIAPDLLFGLFLARSAPSEIPIDIEIGRSMPLLPFEFKFFNPKDSFNSLKVQTDNLKDTQTKYNEITFTYETSQTLESASAMY
jgi:hypothetical protein